MYVFSFKVPLCNFLIVNNGNLLIRYIFKAKKKILKDVYFLYSSLL